jgi:hypothetical protein
MKLKMVGWVRRTKVGSAVSLEPFQLLSCYLAWVNPNFDSCNISCFKGVVNSNRLGYEFGIKPLLLLHIT